MLENLETMSGVETLMILPKRLSRKDVTILLRNHNLSHDLPRVFLGVPTYYCILNRLLVKILTELDLKQVSRVVLAVEFFKLFAENVVLVRV